MTIEECLKQLSNPNISKYRKRDLEKCLKRLKREKKKNG